MDGEVQSLDGRVCLVTGSARKVGSAMAIALGAAGADVAVHYMGSKDAAEKTAAKAGHGAITVRADLTRPKQVDRMFDTVERRLGPVDILINNVGNFLLKPLAKVSIEEWHAIIDENLHCTFYCCRRALPGMRKKKYGRIINMGYGPANRLEPLEGTGLYHLAKTALLVYTKAMAKEEASRGITVNMVSPGTIFTSVNRPSVKTIPAGRYASYSDLVNAVLFLLKDESSYVTGNNLIVAGGKYV
jgi:NAD(P)-dependent dehydrogenase (short-subunit alcohol dehydrogenase family)